MQGDGQAVSCYKCALKYEYTYRVSSIVIPIFEYLAHPMAYLGGPWEAIALGHTFFVSSKFNTYVVGVIWVRKIVVSVCDDTIYLKF